MYSDYGTFGLILGVHSIVRWLVIGLGVGVPPPPNPILPWFCI